MQFFQPLTSEAVLARRIARRRYLMDAAVVEAVRRINERREVIGWPPGVLPEPEPQHITPLHRHLSLDAMAEIARRIGERKMKERGEG